MDALCIQSITQDDHMQLLPMSICGRRSDRQELHRRYFKTHAEAARAGWKRSSGTRPRNFALRADGCCVVCPVADDGDVSGISIFNASVEETVKLMDEDR